jgi:hypothetical protein
MVQAMYPSANRNAHREDDHGLGQAAGRKVHSPFKSETVVKQKPPTSPDPSNLLAIQGDGRASPPSISPMLSMFKKAVSTVKVINRMGRQSALVHTISLGAESLSMMDGGWDKPAPKPPDPMLTKPAESIGQALRKVRNGYDIEGAGQGVGLGVSGKKKKGSKHHGGNDLSGGFFQTGSKKDDPMALHKIFAKQVRCFSGFEVLYLPVRLLLDPTACYLQVFGLKPRISVQSNRSVSPLWWPSSLTICLI